MSGWSSFRFWTYVVAVVLSLMSTVILCVRAFRSQGRDRRLFLIAALMTVFVAVLFTVFNFTNPYR